MYLPHGVVQTSLSPAGAEQLAETHPAPSSSLNHSHQDRVVVSGHHSFWLPTPQERHEPQPFLRAQSPWLYLWIKSCTQGTSCTCKSVGLQKPWMPQRSLFSLCVAGPAVTLGRFLFFFNLLGLACTVVKRVKLFTPSFALLTTEHSGGFLQIFVVFSFQKKD